MKNRLSILVLFFLGCNTIFAQKSVFIEQQDLISIKKNKIVDRQSFPSDFKLLTLDVVGIRQILAEAPERFSGNKGVNLSLPNADGQFETFNVFEYSNFEPALQKQHPNIKSYFAVNQNDKTIIRMSIGLNGINFINFRNNETEYLEPYNDDLTVYAVYKTSRMHKELPLTCSTEDSQIASELLHETSSKIQSSNAELLTFRLALSCTGEYGTFFGGTVASALSQMNTTITNVNAVFENDLSIRLNIIANNSLVMYFNPSTDPYSSGSVGTQNGVWNNELQNTLNTQLGLAAFDVGHLFGSTGGGGNAGCIGCVCLANKGRGYTSPDSGPASGPRFDIDYVAHELGHQFGARHTFSHGGFAASTTPEVGPACVEPGSGSTIMAYAGISGGFDIVNFSSAYFHGYSIEQIQNNMVTKTCPVRTPKINVAPVVNAGKDYTIPISTPFVLEAQATDANANDVLTYCWEQNDAGGLNEIMASSTADPFKGAGPNFRSYAPTSNKLRYFPILSRTIANQKTTLGVDANMLSEALLSTYRLLNFKLTVRDNSPNGGLTQEDDMTVEVNPSAGPFEVTAPNTALSWSVGTNQTVTWSVAGTTVNGINAKFVDIYLSTNGGNDYPILLAAKVPNDGSETIVVPNNVGTTNRIMVKGFEHIFFDISNANFSITAPASSFAIKTPATVGSQNKSACQGTNLIYNLVYETYAGFSGTTNFSITGLPSGLNAVFAPTSLNAGGNVTLTISNTAAFTPGQYAITVNATSGASTKTLPLYFEVVNGTFAVQNLVSPADNESGLPVATILSWSAVANATQYTVQVATNNTFSNIISNNIVTSPTFTANLAEGTQYFWRVLPGNSGCNGLYSAIRSFTTGLTACNTFSNSTAQVISASGTPTISSIINIPNGVNITDVNVSLNITHTNANDLTVTITNPQGAQVFLVANPCSPGNQNIITTFDDEATLDFNCTSGAFFKPATTLDALDLVSSAGNWTLSVSDGAAGNGGTLNSWSVIICGFQSLSSTSNNISNFILYPNPNDGNFTIKFDGDATNEVKVAVIDLRGRSVFEKRYENGQNFNQELNLESLETGLYMINIQNGDRQITKKFIKK